MKSSKTIIGMIAFAAVILFVLTGITAVIGFGILSVLGFEYQSIWSVVLFFALYVSVSLPLCTISESLPEVLRRRLDLGRVTYYLFYVTLNVFINIVIVSGLDVLVDGISIPINTVYFFAVVGTVLDLAARCFDRRGRKKR